MSEELENSSAYNDLKSRLGELNENAKQKKQEEVKVVQAINEELLEHIERVKGEFEEAIKKKNEEIAGLQEDYKQLEEKAEQERKEAEEAMEKKEQECKALKYDNEKIMKENEERKAEHEKYVEEKESELAEMEAKSAALEEKAGSQGDVIAEYNERIKQLEKLVEHLQSRHVPLLKNDKRNHAITFLEKNNGDKETPYLAIIGTVLEVKQEINALKETRRYPRGKVFSITKVPNGVIYFNWLRENEHIEVDPNDERHFRLGTASYNKPLEDLLGFETPCPDIQDCIDLFGEEEDDEEEENDDDEETQVEED